MDNLTEIGTGEKYMIVNIVSKRVRELYAGAKPLVERLDAEESAESIATREYMAGKLKAEPRTTTDTLVDIAQRD